MRLPRREPGGRPTGQPSRSPHRPGGPPPGPIGVKLSGTFSHGRLLDLKHGIALCLQAFERGQSRTLSVLQANGDDERELRPQVSEGLTDTGEEHAHEREGPLLKALVEFLHTDFPALRIPEPVGFGGVDAMNDDL